MTTTLATLEDFSAARGVQFDPTDLAAIIALEGASDAVRSYTGQSFDAITDDVVTLDGTGREGLLLPQLPVSAVSEVVIISSDGIETTLDPAVDYRLGGSGILWRFVGLSAWPWWGSPIWPLGRQNVRVTHDHGYALPGDEGDPPLPSDIQLVTMQVAARGLAVATSAGRLVSAETIGSYSISYDTAQSQGADLLELEKRILDHYRLARVA